MRRRGAALAAIAALVIAVAFVGHAATLSVSGARLGVFTYPAAIEVPAAPGLTLPNVLVDPPEPSPGVTAEPTASPSAVPESTPTSGPSSTPSSAPSAQPTATEPPTPMMNCAADMIGML